MSGSGTILHPVPQAMGVILDSDSEAFQAPLPYCSQLFCISTPLHQLPPPQLPAQARPLEWVFLPGTLPLDDIFCPHSWTEDGRAKAE